MQDKIAASYPDAPKVGVGVILFKGEQVLLVKRANPPGAGRWSLPGGKQELGEAAVQTARRELREETGLECGPLTLAGYADSIHHDESGRITFHYTILDFVAQYVGGTPVPSDDVLDAVWAFPHELDAYELWDEARRLVTAASNLL